jgi:ATP-dependent RNA helicase DDX46/PRP5
MSSKRKDRDELKDRDKKAKYEDDRRRERSSRDRREKSSSSSSSSSSSRSSRDKDKERDTKREESSKQKEESTTSPPVAAADKKDDADKKEEIKKRLEAWKKAQGIPIDEPNGAEVDTTAPATAATATDSTPAPQSMDVDQPKALPNLRKRMAKGEDEELDEGVDEKEVAPKAEEVAKKKDEDDDNEIDPLDAFMFGIAEQVKKEKVPSTASPSGPANGSNSGPKEKVRKMGEYIDNEDNIPIADFSDSDSDDDSKKKSKKKNLQSVDHAKIEYEPFKKDFYIEVPEIAKMTKEEVDKFREEHDNIRVRGKGCPKPIKGFYQCGLVDRIQKVLEKLGYHQPTSIQMQALPAVMSGRDVIGIAKTGSGKTLSFLLPMLRHIMDQPALRPGEGPIGLVMAPTRELAMQIHTEFLKFTKALGLRAVCVYGGAGVATQIAELKRGAEIVVCTPGRMIDMLCTNAGRVANLQRVTFLVLDEADRMFDMGFEPQITRIIQNTRPDRQTVLFSATFPRTVEALAKKILQKPVEIIVGGRSVVCSDVEQHVEVISEDAKFNRLVELVKEWFEKGLILVFVDRQEAADKLFTDLLQAGYPCCSLHGGKDQQDRDFTIDDFKRKVFTVMIATSVAARGLDVKDLNLVVNYDVPNHMEDYVHRVGRTGRAGRKGTAYTFITPEEEKYTPDIVKALEASETPVPEDVKRLADSYLSKKKSGVSVEAHGSGYGGKGFKFDEAEQQKRDEERKMAKKAYGIEEEEPDEEADSDEDKPKIQGVETIEVDGVTVFTGPAVTDKASVIQQAMQQVLGKSAPSTLPIGHGMNKDKIAEIANLIVAQSRAKNAPGVTDHFAEEMEINDYPQQARWKVTHKDALGAITEWTGAAITTRGSYVAPGRNPPPGERKLYLFIEGPDATCVRKAKQEIKRILEETMATSAPERAMYGKYTVV